MLAYLRDLTGSDFRGKSFDSRLRIQKAVYFLKQFKHPWTSDYSFGDYFHGPYSLSLAGDYYRLMTEALPATPYMRVDLPKHAASCIGEAVKRGNDFLEAAATIHIFLARNPGASREKAVRHLNWIKPQLAPYASEALLFLEKYRMIQSAT